MNNSTEELPDLHWCTNCQTEIKNEKDERSLITPKINVVNIWALVGEKYLFRYTIKGPEEITRFYEISIRNRDWITNFSKSSGVALWAVLAVNDHLKIEYAHIG